MTSTTYSQAELDTRLGTVIQRANHTGTQSSATISDFVEAVQDAVGAFFGAGTGATVSYNDAANTITVSATGTSDPEAIRDAIGAAIFGVGNITVTINDAADTITVSTTATVNSTDAALRDRSTHTGTQSASTITGLAIVATTGAYSDLSGKPAIPAAYTDAQALAAVQPALDRKVSQLGPSNGIDDTVTINAALTAAAGAVIRGMPGVTYYVDAPIIVPSTTELNMTGCVIQQITGSAPRNMLRSAAFANARTLNDVAITASSTTLTSATGAFTSGDVGKAVRVYLGDIGRARFLNTTIASVTNSTTVVLATAPDVTVAITGASIGTRDKNVRIIGGKWRRFNLTGTVPINNDQHTFMLRRTDGLTVSPEEMGQGTGKYMISIADCNRFKVEDVFFDQAPSDGIHLGGFSFDGTIRRIAGQVGDDLFAITAADYTAYNDCSGDVSDISVDDVILHKSTGPTRFLISSDSSSQSYSYINVRRIGLSRIGTQELYQTSTSTPVGRLLMSGVLSGISVERTSIFMTYNRDGGTSGTMYLADLTIRDWTPRLDAATDALNVNDNAGTIIIDGVTDGGGAQTSRNIIVLGFTAKTVAVDRVIIRNARWESTIGQARGVTMYPSVNVGYIEVDGGNFGGSSGAGNRVIDISGTCTCEAVTLRDVKTSAFGAWAVSHGGSGVTRLHIENSKLQSTSPFRTANTGGFDISGSNTVWGGTPNLAGTGVVRPVSTDVRLDVGLLPKVAGALAFNTNAARSCGLGPVYCDGTNWVHLATSATY